MNNGHLEPAAKIQRTPHTPMFELCISRAAASLQVGLLTSSLHVYPDFFGNRSPLADPLMKGSVTGLGQSASIDDLALLYLATLQVGG
jgi:ribulose kinase